MCLKTPKRKKPRSTFLEPFPKKKRFTWLFKALPPLIFTTFLLTLFWSFPTEQEVFTIVGSTSVAPLMELLTQRYRNVDKQVSFKVLRTGSEAGLQILHEDKADLSTISRDLLKEETKGFEQHRIAHDPLVLIAHSSVPPLSLSRLQVQKIFTEEMDNWQQIGGPDLPLVAVSRDQASGTRTAFLQLLGLKEESDRFSLVSGSQNVVDFVRNTPGAVGYVSWAFRTPLTTMLAFDGVMPDPTQVIEGNYLLSRPFILLVPDGSPAALHRFVQWILSPEGQGLVSSHWVAVH